MHIVISSLLGNESSISDGTELEEEKVHPPGGEVTTLNVLPLLEGRSRCNEPNPLALITKLKSSKLLKGGSRRNAFGAPRFVEPQRLDHLATTTPHSL